MNLLKYVNIDVGTDSEYRESNGNTLPNVQYPFGNQAYVFQTNKVDNGWFYKPNANYTEGIRVTNQPSPWLGDYGHITLLPFNGKYDIDLHSSLVNKYHKPNIMSGLLRRYNIEFELVPTKRGAVLKVNGSSPTAKLLIDCHQNNTHFEYTESQVMITNKNVPDGEFSHNYRKYYCIKFDCKIINVNVHHNGSQIELELDNSDYRIDLVSSYISQELCNEVTLEQSNQKYQKLKTQVEKKWNQYLRTIEIESKISKCDLEIFYSNLYRTFCFPRIISEKDSKGKEVYYNFKTKTIDCGAMISDVGFWDTYRTTVPLQELLVPKVYKTIVDATLNYYKSYGWLPRWLAPYERGIMPSTLVDSVVASAIVTKAYDKEQIPIAIEALLKNACVASQDKLFGREHLNEYLEYGYVPAECNGESVSLSLDNFYCDYAIYKALESVEHEMTSRFKSRCQGYTKLFNKHSKLFERLNREEEFDLEFNPNEWGYDFCESSAWQNNLNIFHDNQVVIELMGGFKEVEKRLDYLFNSTPQYTVGRYGFEIHEMTEYSRLTDLGHFAISNQPSFNMPFWYLNIGAEEKFLNVINRTHKYFTNQPDGYPGDEDNGSLAAWYVFTCIGKYPFCPIDGMIDFKGQFNYKINKI